MPGRNYSARLHPCLLSRSAGRVPSHGMLAYSLKCALSIRYATSTRDGAQAWIVGAKIGFLASRLSTLWPRPVASRQAQWNH